MLQNTNRSFKVKIIYQTTSYLLNKGLNEFNIVFHPNLKNDSCYVQIKVNIKQAIDTRKFIASALHRYCWLLSPQNHVILGGGGGAKGGLAGFGLFLILCIVGPIILSLAGATALTNQINNDINDDKHGKKLQITSFNIIVNI